MLAANMAKLLGKASPAPMMKSKSEVPKQGRMLSSGSKHKDSENMTKTKNMVDIEMDADSDLDDFEEKN